MRQGHAFLMPSLVESFGIVQFEAMAHGPVPVVPNRGVQREIVDNGTAGCIARGDSQALSMIVERLSEDVALRRTLRGMHGSGFAASMIRRLWRAYTAKSSIAPPNKHKRGCRSGLIARPARRTRCGLHS